MMRGKQMTLCKRRDGAEGMKWDKVVARWLVDKLMR